VPRQPATTYAHDPRRFVLGTKVMPPPDRDEHIARERLFRRLDAATTRPLTLVAAPTGFGKTTLLSAWSRRATRRTAWLTITAGDSDIVRLAAGIVASLLRAGVLRDDGLARDLVAPGIDVAAQVLPQLLDALDDGQPLVLVLDDYHLLSGVAAHGLIDTLLADMPPSMRVVIATRADPELRLGRLRASGSMDEVRADELRFDPDEAARFLNGSLGLDLDRDSLETLEARTEGWPAGLYLAALTLRVRSDRARFVTEFAGSSRHVVDYLSAEVLDGLPSGDRTFLLRTSILERMSGSLCDAVTGMTGSATRLRDLERANLFIVPLDEDRTWFRFHRLFAQLLRSELDREAPELLPELHRRAAAWHAESGRVEAAVDHALAAGDRVLGATLVARSWRELVRNGQYQTLERLIGAIGTDRGALTGPLAAVEAMVVGLMGRDPRLVERLVEAAEASGWVGPTPDGRSIDTVVAVVTASLVGLDLDRETRAARQLVDDHPDDPELLTAGRAALGMNLLLGGDASGALAALGPDTPMSGYPNAELYGSAARSLAIGEAGDPIAAERLARAALARAEGWGLDESRVGGSLWLALGTAIAGQGRPHGALPLLERSLSLFGVPGTLYRAYVLIALAEAYGAVGESAKARAAARDARAIVDAAPSAGVLPERLAAVERRLRVATERPIRAGDRPSDAELRVLRLLATSLTAREIAGELFISVNTAKTHTRALYQKLGTSSREDAVLRAKELGLL